MRIANEPSAVEQLLRVLGEKGISVLGYHVERAGGDGSVLQMEMNLKFSESRRVEQLMPIIQQYPFIQQKNGGAFASPLRVHIRLSSFESKKVESIKASW